MHIQYICQGEVGHLDALKQDRIFYMNLLRQLVIIAAHSLPVIRIREVLARIRIRFHKKNRICTKNWLIEKTFYCLMYSFKNWFLVVMECKEIKKCISPYQKFNFVTKISQKIVYFCKKKFREITKLFRETQNKFFVDHLNIGVGAGCDFSLRYGSGATRMMGLNVRFRLHNTACCWCNVFTT
jgi:hypothetical protein